MFSLSGGREMKISRISKIIFFPILILSLIVPAFSKAILVNAKSSQLLYSTIPVMFYELSITGASIGIPCTVSTVSELGDMNYGCTAFVNDTSHSFPYGYNPENVEIETDYLLDVIPQEMGEDSQVEALTVQAIVSRSFANYFAVNLPPQGYIDNSTNFQVAIPYRFQELNLVSSPNNPLDPCVSTNLNSSQGLVCNAVSSIIYLSMANDANNGYRPSKALFFSDIVNRTIDATYDKPYLKAVDDPISTTCDAVNYGPGWGLSQKGAKRWLRGDKCSTTSGGTQPWTVRWYFPSQVLFHYYTGEDLIDENGNRLTPEYRWNPLSISLSGNCPPIMYSGQTCTGSFTIQNTGSTTWFSQQYKLTMHGWGNDAQSSLVSQSIVPGNSITEVISFSAPNPSAAGTAYFLSFDMAYWDNQNGWIKFSQMEPSKPWVTYKISVCVGGPCKIFVPMVNK
jgi:hypothetical protein